MYVMCNEWMYVFNLNKFNINKYLIVVFFTIISTILQSRRDPGIPGSGKTNPEIPGLIKSSGIAISIYNNGNIDLKLWVHINEIMQI